MLRKHIYSFLLLVIVFVAFSQVQAKRSSLVSIDAANFKQIQGDPSEFRNHLLPEPEDAAMHGRAATVSIFLDKEDNVWKWKGTIPVDSATQYSISFVSKMKNLEIRVLEIKSAHAANRGEVVKPEKDMHALATKVEKTWFGWTEDQSVPATVYLFTNPTPGYYTVEIISKEAPTTTVASPHVIEKPHVLLIFSSDSPFKTYSHLGQESYLHMKTSDKISFATMVYNENNGVKALRKEDDAFVAADLEIILPNGEEKVISMHDDGKDGDLIANDGIFGAQFQVPQEGSYTAKAVVSGVNPFGYPFVRSTTHLFYVVDNEQIELLSRVGAKISPDDEIMTFFMNIKFDEAKKGTVLNQKFTPYAEVWATSESDSTQMVPVCFVEAMSIAKVKPSQIIKLENGFMQATFEVSMSMKWFDKAKATFPIQLRNVHIQDADYHIPIATLKSADVDISLIEFPEQLQTNDKAMVQTLFSAIISQFRYTGEITETMKMGKKPAKYAISSRSTEAGAKLILVHGYCSADNPFEVSHFENAAPFLDSRQTRTNDQFALLVRDYAEKHGGFGGYTIAGHSQGGLVGMQLYTFYWSGVDVAVAKPANNATQAERRILQSVGSPYYGNSIAGDVANLGKTFGVGCGKNFDLTRDGAALWMAGIPLETRKMMYFYTTQYKDWSWCNLAANAVLKWPNDGTAEYEYAVLKEGHNKGHVKAQCHSVNMKYEPQCKNASRCKDINANAAR